MPTKAELEDELRELKLQLESATSARDLFEAELNTAKSDIEKLHVQIKIKDDLIRSVTDWVATDTLEVDVVDGIRRDVAQYQMSMKDAGFHI